MKHLCSKYIRSWSVTYFLCGHYRSPDLKWHIARGVSRLLPSANCMTSHNIIRRTDILRGKFSLYIMVVMKDIEEGKYQCHVVHYTYSCLILRLQCSHSVACKHGSSAIARTYIARNSAYQGDAI